MAGEADQVRRREVAVEYAAVDAVADRDRLCAWLRGEIERHLLSITEVPITGWNLQARITECRMTANHGSVRLTVGGTVSGRPVEKFVVVSDQPTPIDFLTEDPADEATKVAFANLFTLLGRLLFPSELVRALGRRRISGRLVRAWHDACREIRIAIDEAVARPPSGGLRTWRKTLRTAVVAGIGFFALSAAQKALFRPHQRDDFTAWMGCGFIGIGVFGVVAATGLLLLPSRFYQSERRGLELARLCGVRTLAGIRVVACGLALLALLAFLVPGVWLRFFN